MAIYKINYLNRRLDRNYLIATDANKNSFFTLGIGSLNGESSIMACTSHVKQVSIGRYSTVRFTDFRLGMNHPYKNVVSTTVLTSVDISRMFPNENKQFKQARFSPEQTNNHHQVMIGSDVWFGWNVGVLGGVHVGSGAIVGANTMLTKDVPPYAIVVGNPARIIKYRFDKETIKKFMAIKWWNWDVDKVLDNYHLFNDVDTFLEKHYSPELKKIPYETIQSLEKSTSKTDSQKSESFVIVSQESLQNSRGGGYRKIPRRRKKNL